MEERRRLDEEQDFQAFDKLNMAQGVLMEAADEMRYSILFESYAG